MRQDKTENAKCCLGSAELAVAMGNDIAARKWAVKSLAYSVGILSPVYEQAFKGAGYEGETRLV